MDDSEHILCDWKVSHGFSAFHEAIIEFKGIQEQQRVEITFAIEGENGYGAPFDRMLIENGFNPKNAINSKRAGMDARKPFVLKHLKCNAAILDSIFLCCTNYANCSITSDNPVEYKGVEGICACYVIIQLHFLGLQKILYTIV